ncbi:unnamed protein product [Adineta steineri]|uniref:Uncharacterized protein n=2 Tax=Adineta steineri TaxID=433720 RepID=A0A818JYS8_9BILA|nr:unnamed protein product [Adineta steineri]CAF3547498.1 unnamed protein product [Adineta steineri]
MSFFSLFITLVLISVVHSGTIRDINNDSSCETHIDKLDTCKAIISFSGDCYSSTVDISKTEYAKCLTNSFFWSYPLNNMTLIIGTQFTQQQQPYTILIDNEQVISTVSHVYRIINDKETEVTTQEKSLKQHSDTNYQIILKFQGPTKLGRYGVNINYESYQRL